MASTAGMEATTEAGLTTKGVLIGQAAVIEAAECAGVTAPLRVGRDESPLRAMVEVTCEIVATSKIAAAVDKCVAP